MRKRAKRSVGLLLVWAAIAGPILVRCHSEDAPRPQGSMDAGSKPGPTDGAGPDVTSGGEPVAAVGRYGGARAIEPDEAQQYVLCGAGPDAITPGDLERVQSAFDTPMANVIEVPVSSDGCLRAVRETADGVVEVESLIAFTGNLQTDFDPSRGVAISATYVTLARWVRDEDGTLRGEFDDDGSPFETDDEFREVRTIERPGFYQVTQYNPASQDVERRFTREEADDTVTQIEERAVDGDLQTTSRSFALTEAMLFPMNDANYQGKSLTDSQIAACRAKVMRCSKDQEKAMNDAMNEALSKSIACLGGIDNGGEGLSRLNYLLLKALRDGWNRKHVWGCMPKGCDFAFTPLENFAIGYGLDLWNGQDANGRQSVLAHEIFHHLFGGHDEWLGGWTNVPNYEQIRAYADPVYGCQDYCFNPQTTRCACASCLETTTCDDRCDFLDSCEVTDCSSGNCKKTMSSSLAAFILKGSDSAQWFMSMDECNDFLALTEGECRDYSRDCDPSE